MNRIYGLRHKCRMLLVWYKRGTNVLLCSTLATFYPEFWNGADCKSLPQWMDSTVFVVPCHYRQCWNSCFNFCLCACALMRESLLTLKTHNMPATYCGGSEVYLIKDELVFFILIIVTFMTFHCVSLQLLTSFICYTFTMHKSYPGVQTFECFPFVLSGGNRALWYVLKKWLVLCLWASHKVSRMYR